MKAFKRFFTLIEILTVAAIIAILSGISIGVVFLINNKNAEAKTQATIKALEMALTRFKAENGYIYLPPGKTSSDMKKPIMLTVPNPKDASNASLNLKGTLLKYLDEQLLRSSTVVDGTNLYFVDAWGHPLIYRIPGKFNTSGFDLGSVGPDGKLGDGKPTDKEITKTELTKISATNYANYFGQGDDITNFLRN